MSDYYKYRESQLAKALDAWGKNIYKSKAACAKEFGVEPRLFQRRIQLGRSKSTRDPAGGKLSEHQELALKEYIEFLDDIELSLRILLIRNAANALLRHANPGSAPPRIGKNWVARFLRRNPQFFIRKGKPLAAERKNAHKVEDIAKYFENYEEVVREYGITPDDTWNMDETGFRVGCGVSHLVVTLSPNRRILITDPDNRDFITSAECINGVGGSIKSFLILKGVNILDKWALQNDLDDEVTLATSDSGYSNDVLALEWLKHFDKQSSKRQKGRFRLLIMDGYGSHLTYEFWKYATQKDIILFRLPPHSTHFTQPLDVGLFQPMKHYHAEAVDNAIRLGDADFSRQDFLAAFNQFRIKTFKPSSILSAWRKTGLIPYNPEIVLEKIRPKDVPQMRVEYTPMRPGRTPSPPSISLPFTPKKPREVIDEGENITKRLENGEVVTPERLRKYIKGSCANADALELIQDDVRLSNTYNLAKRSRSKLAATVAQKGGVITVHEVREKHLTKTIMEEERVVKAQERAEAAKQKRIMNHGKQLAKQLKLRGKGASQWMDENMEFIYNSFHDQEDNNN